MTEPTLFRKVFCADTLPPFDVEVDTDLGKWVRYEDDPYKEESKPSYWYEPVPEPTEEEIDGIAASNCKHCLSGEDDLEDYYDGKFSGFTEGFKKALELLKGK